MFEDYLQDSYEFFSIASQSSDDRQSRQYFRASVFCAGAAIEAFLNYVADSFAQAENLPAHERAFLNDKMLFFSPKKMKTLERTEYHKLEDKLRVLIHRFLPSFDFNSPGWSGLMEFKKFRDSLVHPRKYEDETEILDYKVRVRAGISAILQIMNQISKGVFSMPLRRKLLDLIPEQSE